MIENGNVTQSELSKLIGINEKNIRNNIKNSKDLGPIHRIGSPKTGYWEVKMSKIEQKIKYTISRA